jgi:hypothetical protein
MLTFLNSKTRKPYPHALIPGTDLYICLHSGNEEKLEALKKLPLALGYPAESIKVSLE